MSSMSMLFMSIPFCIEVTILHLCINYVQAPGVPGSALLQVDVNPHGVLNANVLAARPVQRAAYRIQVSVRVVLPQATTNPDATPTDASHSPEACHLLVEVAGLRVQAHEEVPGVPVLHRHRRHQLVFSHVHSFIQFRRPFYIYALIMYTGLDPGNPGESW